jgi:hypothetical protein
LRRRSYQRGRLHKHTLLLQLLPGGKQIALASAAVLA